MTLDLKKIIYIFSLLGLFFLSFLSSTDSKIQNTIPEPVDITLVSIAIAITELETDSNGYSGYRHVLKSLQDQEPFKEYIKSQKKYIPNDIDLKKAVLAARSNNSNYKFYLDREDLGIIDYYKLSFSLFDYNTDSFILLYYLILMISLVIFLVRFFNNFDKLYFLLIFMISHWVVVSVLPSIGNELLTVYNRRSLPMLSIIPTLYVVFSIFENRRLNGFGLAMLIIQIAILIFIYHSRSSVSYQFFFIYASFLFLCILELKTKLKNILISKSALLSVLIITISVCFLKGYMYLAKDPQYSNFKSGHLFWHSAYIGLSAHPESFEKYGIYLADSASVDFVESKAMETHGTEDWYSVGGHQYYENTLKEEYLSIMKNDPVFFLKNYAIKPYLFLNTFFESPYWLDNKIIKSVTIIFIFIGGFLTSNMALKSLFKFGLFLIAAFSFSLLPSLFISTEVSFYILDPSILFLVLIYWFFSLIIAFTIYTIKIISKKGFSYEKYRF